MRRVGECQLFREKMKIPTRKSSNTGGIFFQICNETAYNDMKYAKECARCKRVLIEPNFLSVQSMIIMQKSARCKRGFFVTNF